VGGAGGEAWKGNFDQAVGVRRATDVLSIPDEEKETQDSHTPSVFLFGICPGIIHSEILALDFPLKNGNF